MTDQRNAIAYLRVSTIRQGRSGLGLEAQREAVARYAAEARLELVGEFVEVETGKGSNALTKRPQLLAALAEAKKGKAKLVLAKLDRLARNVHFISGLMETGVDFAVADMPNADRFQLHLYAALAEKEAEIISQRTKAALAAAKARGTVLGRNGKHLAMRNKVEAKARLEPVSNRLSMMRAEGLSIRKMVAALNAEKVHSPCGGTWHPANLHRALKRLGL
ncbi:recombinase family protein [Pontixanthobacter luteolus]|uniref:recombinase family protein n=1 Tax=Pontixanthobacter luteolus TaxID=295089 RepID=UPI002302CAF2|nr:recombinase family protein [Pontixanthobacter luteolus]